MTGFRQAARLALHGMAQQRDLGLRVAWGVCLSGWTAVAVLIADRRPPALGIVLLAGIMLGLLSAVIASRARRGFATAGQLERAFALPVIGTIGPILSTADHLRAAARRQRFFAGVLGLICVYGLAVALCWLA